MGEPTSDQLDLLDLSKPVPNFSKMSVEERIADKNRDHVQEYVKNGGIMHATVSGSKDERIKSQINFQTASIECPPVASMKSQKDTLFKNLAESARLPSSDHFPTVNATAESVFKQCTANYKAATPAINNQSNKHR